MRAPFDPRERMREVQRLEIDGKAWYLLGDVCDALRCDKRKAAPRVEKVHKHRVFEYRRGYRSVVLTYLDRQGVEALCMLYGEIPRHEIMAALQ